MNYLNITSTIFTAFFLLSGNASAQTVSERFNAMKAKASGVIANATGSTKSTGPAAYAFTRPMACTAAANKTSFVNALKTYKTPADNAKLEGLLNCSGSYARMAELTKDDLMEDGKIPEHLAVALKDELEGIEYGNLQIDNDRTFLTCIASLKAELTDSLCESTDCTADGLKSKLKALKSCQQPLMSHQIDAMVDDIISRKGTSHGVNRGMFIEDAKKIVNAAPQIAVKASVALNKVQEADKLKARKALQALLDVPSSSSEETAAEGAVSVTTDAPVPAAVGTAHSQA